MDSVLSIFGWIFIIAGAMMTLIGLFYFFFTNKVIGGILLIFGIVGLIGGSFAVTKK